MLFKKINVIWDRYLNKHYPYQKKKKEKRKKWDPTCSPNLQSYIVVVSGAIQYTLMVLLEALMEEEDHGMDHKIISQQVQVKDV